MRPNPDHLMTTADFLDEIKERRDLKSDSAVSRLLGVTQSAVSLQRAMKNTFDDETARRVAELLDYDPAYVFVCAHAQSARNPAVKSVWARMAKHATAAGIVAVLLAGALPLIPAGNAHAASMYIMSTILLLLMAGTFAPMNRYRLAN